MDNPWRHLPAEPPFVLRCDKKGVDEFNQKVGRSSKSFLQVGGILPEPFIGNPDAPVVLLSNNPGFGKRAHLRAEREFKDRMRNNLDLGTSDYPFIYLDPALAEVGKWWKAKLRKLIADLGTQVVARSVLNVVYFPYASERLGRKPPDLPSQKFGFKLVCDAVERGAMIIVMRKGKLKWWREKVKGLKPSDRLVVLKNPQNPTISPGNCGKRAFEKVVAAIRRAESAP
jgi:hypothetical protein